MGFGDAAFTYGGLLVNAIADFWGLTLNQTLLLLAAILIIVDFFLSTDVVTHVAYVIVAFVIARSTGLHFMYQILIGLVAWFAIVAFHYLVWRGITHWVANTLIAPDRYRSGADGLVGETGVVKRLDDVAMVELRGDLWPCKGAAAFATGDRVRVTGVNEGVLTVQAEERSE